MIWNKIAISLSPEEGKFLFSYPEQILWSAWICESEFFMAFHSTFLTACLLFFAVFPAAILQPLFYSEFFPK